MTLRLTLWKDIKATPGKVEIVVPCVEKPRRPDAVLAQPEPKLSKPKAEGEVS